MCIWKTADAEGRILIPKDGDFLILATRPGDPGRLLWLRTGDCRTQDLLSRLNQDWDVIGAAFSEDQRIVDVG